MEKIIEIPQKKFKEIVELLRILTNHWNSHNKGDFWVEIGQEVAKKASKLHKELNEKPVTSLRLDGDKNKVKLLKKIDKLCLEHTRDYYLALPQLILDECISALSLSSDEKGETDNFNSEEEILP